MIADILHGQLLQVMVTLKCKIKTKYIKVKVRLRLKVLRIGVIICTGLHRKASTTD